MKQRTEILNILNNSQDLTQSQIAERAYGDTNHSTAIYTALQKLVNEGAIVKNGSPARYRLANHQNNNSTQINYSRKSASSLNEDEQLVFSKEWEISNLIYEVSKRAGHELVPGLDFYVVHQPFGHSPIKLPNNRMAVYSFHDINGECLKVGQAGYNSNNRYQGQHYHVKNSSTLSKSLIEDEEFSDFGLTDKTVGDWIKENCERYDVIIRPVYLNGAYDKSKSKIILNMIEGTLQLYFDPRYEG